jgi:hypothetical protein
VEKHRGCDRRRERDRLGPDQREREEQREHRRLARDGRPLERAYEHEREDEEAREEEGLGHDERGVAGPRHQRRQRGDGEAPAVGDDGPREHVRRHGGERHPQCLDELKRVERRRRIAGEREERADRDWVEHAVSEVGRAEEQELAASRHALREVGVHELIAEDEWTLLPRPAHHLDCHSERHEKRQAPRRGERRERRTSTADATADRRNERRDDCDDANEDEGAQRREPRECPQEWSVQLARNAQDDRQRREEHPAKEQGSRGHAVATPDPPGSGAGHVSVLPSGAVQEPHRCPYGSRTGRGYPCAA